MIKTLQSEKTNGESPIIWHFCTYRTCRHALDMIRRMQTKAYISGMRCNAVLRNKIWLTYGWLCKILIQTLTTFRFIYSDNERRSQVGPQTLNCGPEAEFLDEIQTKVLKVFLLSMHSHFYSFSLRFQFLQTHATFYSFYSSVTAYCKRERRKTYSSSYCTL